MRVSMQRLERAGLAALAMLMLVGVGLLLGAAPAHAHKASDAYLQLQRKGRFVDVFAGRQ